MTPRRIALAVAVAVTAALAGGSTATAATASTAEAAAPPEIVDQVVCYVKTRDAYVCFRMGPGAQARTAVDDVCVTYDFAGSEFCVLEETGAAVETARQLLRDNDRCVTYDFAGSEFCVVRDTIG
jgi:hypothetical protein